MAISGSGIITSINKSKEKGMKKSPVNDAYLSFEGIAGDAHAGKWHRQVSFLAEESIKKIKDKGLDVKAGDFAENITTRGFDFSKVKIGDQLKVGQATVEITQLGKECHSRCNIYHQVGDCVMPKEGVFGKVIKEGKIKIGDPLDSL